MKLGFLALAADERRLYIEQAAVRRDVSSVILEKDFRVCWLLGILFESPFAGSLVFKGGTSLSKVFGVIEVVALELERTFWERSTILHTEYHRPEDKPTPDRFSRHYADTAAMAKHPAAGHAIEQHNLRDRVVGSKSQFFGSSWANYGQAKPGTFRLVPPQARQAKLRRDYQAMRDVYLTEPASFDNILATLGELERRINIDQVATS